MGNFEHDGLDVFTTSTAIISTPAILIGGSPTLSKFYSEGLMWQMTLRIRLMSTKKQSSIDPVTFSRRWSISAQNIHESVVKFCCTTNFDRPVELNVYVIRAHLARTSFPRLTISSKLKSPEPYYLSHTHRVPPSCRWPIEKILSRSPFCMCRDRIQPHVCQHRTLCCANLFLPSPAASRFLPSTVHV